MRDMRDAAGCGPILSFGKPRSSIHACLAFLIFALCGFACAGTSAQKTTNKNVLVLFSALKYSDEFLNAVEPAIRNRVPGQITFFDAYLDDRVVDEETYRDSEAETLRRRYSRVKFDLVIACNPPALDLAVDYRDRIFPGVPIVFVGVARENLARQKTWPGVTGVLTSMAYRETIDLALRLEPDTKAVALVEGATPWDSAVLQDMQSALAPYNDRVREIDLAEPPTSHAVERVTALPPHTIVLFQEYPQFSNQPQFGTWDLLHEVAQRRPTYSAFPRLCIDGCIGGVYEDPNQTWSLTAELASRVLHGDRVENIPIVENTNLHPQVDWRALQRWHISERMLPPGTVVLFREPTLWERGRKYFLLGFAIIFIQAVLIFGLLWQRAQKRKTEAELRRSEEKFSRSFRHSPLAITIVRTSDDRYVDTNESFEQLVGWKREEVIGRTPLEIGIWLDSKQRSGFMNKVLTDGPVRNHEVRFRRKDGQIRTSLGSAELIEVGGEPCVLSVIADITERKAAEETLATLSGRLIEAQEGERTRIARELHDDISQRLAMVAVTLKRLKKHALASDEKASGLIEEASTGISDLGQDVQALSHRLHSSKLEYLGLHAAAEGFCAEVSERQNVEIDFRCDAIPEGLSGQISLCLFRVLQEAVHNALKYSGVGRFEVSLATASNAIQLRVHDSGAGFDTTASKGHGLGLTSMNERLKLVNGQLSIESKPGQGTTILARVPFEAGAANSGEACLYATEPQIRENSSSSSAAS